MPENREHSVTIELLSNYVDSLLDNEEDKLREFIAAHPEHARQLTPLARVARLILASLKAIHPNPARERQSLHALHIQFEERRKGGGFRGWLSRLWNRT